MRVNRTSLRGLAAFSLILSAAASGFSSVIIQIHQNITTAALGPATQYEVKGYSSYSFSAPAILAINHSHYDQDITQDHKVLCVFRRGCKPYAAEDHFDSESLIGSYKALVQWRKALMHELKNQAQPNQKVAWVLTGMSLHLIQDFYAHSTWVREKGETIVDFGKLIASGVDKPDGFTDPASIGAVCEYDGSSYLPGSQLSTGYYPPRQRRDGACHHGELLTSLAYCNNQLANPFGINLDFDCPANPAVWRPHNLAVQSATEESRRYMRSVISELAEGGYYFGICILMDLDPDTPFCRGSWSGTYTIVSCDEPGVVGNVGIGACTHTLHARDQNLAASMAFKEGPAEDHNFRRDWSLVAANVCDAEPQGVNISLNVGAEIKHHFLFASSAPSIYGTPQETVMTFTVVTASPTQVAGTFTATYSYIADTTPDDWTDNPDSYKFRTGTAQGTWSAVRRTSNFPKCLYRPAADVCVQGPNGGGDIVLSGEEWQSKPCDFRAVNEDPRPDEWLP